MISQRKLRWQCRRGLLELDILLGRFLENQYEQLSDLEKKFFAELLHHPDQQLLHWLTDQEIPPAEFVSILNAVRES